MDEVAQLPFGLAEDLMRGLADEQASDGEEVVGAGAGDGLGQVTGLDFLLGSKRGRDNPQRVAWWISRLGGSFRVCVQEFH